MTLPSSGTIAISQISTEIGQPSTYTDSLSFLNSLLLSPVSTPSLTAFYGLTYYQNTNQGNCSNGNCTSNCNCGNIQCTNCLIVGTVDCVNCQPKPYLQTGNNCTACTYNCQTSPVLYNCNCACNCSKIVCANLYEKGLMSPDIWSADQAYGKLLRKTDKRVYRGYIKWARIVTMWMDARGPDFIPWIKDKELRKNTQQAKMLDMAQKIGTPWSEHMAYLMGTLKTDNTMGRILMNIGRPICRLISYIPKARRARHGLATTWTIWFFLYASYYTAKLLSSNTVKSCSLKELLND